HQGAPPAGFGEGHRSAKRSLVYVAVSPGRNAERKPQAQPGRINGPTYYWCSGKDRDSYGYVGFSPTRGVEARAGRTPVCVDAEVVPIGRCGSNSVPRCW